MSKRLKQTFLQRNSPVIKHMKRCYTLIISEIQSKTTMRYCFKPIRMTIIKQTKITSLEEDVEKKKFHF